MIDPTTALDAAGLAALIALLVQVTKPFIAGMPSQADKLHLLSTVLGGILVPVAVLTGAGAHFTAASIVTAVEEGLSLGAGVTISVAAAKTAAAKAPKVSVNLPSASSPEKLAGV